MTTGRLPDRDRPEPEALLADRYLDDLLSAAERGADAVPADAALGEAMRDSAAILRRALVRVHPSFRFEERLAARLAELAADQARPAAAGANGTVLRFDAAFAEPASPRDARSRRDADDPLLAAILAGDLDPAADAALDADPRLAGMARPLLVGGAITSAAISLVGVAWVAWRAARPVARGASTPMGRAARAARARRPAASAGVVGGLGGPA